MKTNLKKLKVIYKVEKMKIFHHKIECNYNFKLLACMLKKINTQKQLRKWRIKLKKFKE